MYIWVSIGSQHWDRSALAETFRTLRKYSGSDHRFQTSKISAGTDVAVNRKPLEITHPRVCDFLGNRTPPLEIATPPPYIVYQVLILKVHVIGT